MNSETYIYNSESVSKGHPDKICDQISDALVDMFLAQNNFAHLGIETLVTVNRVIVAGEVKGVEISAQDIDDIIRNLVKEIGYNQLGFSYKNLTINNYLHEQSEDIAHSVGSINGRDSRAGDQGYMYGFACKETETYMPAPIYYAHRLLHNLQEARKQDFMEKLGPDAKCQVTMKYKGFTPISLEAVVLSTQHHADLTMNDINDIVLPVIERSFPESLMKEIGQIYINPSGRFVIGGPNGDTGLTGRKINVDSYGSACPPGGGAFSGKDPTKVDRSAAYMMRYLAKNIVAANLCDRCTLQISYAIGRDDPISFSIDTHQTSKLPNVVICDFVKKNFDLTPTGIREFLNLNRPIYLKTATFGHFGREPESNGCFSWEKLDSVPLFKTLF